jgi:hypothetical protein
MTLEAWVNGIVENLANAWPLLAPHIDDALNAAAIGSSS